MSAQHQEGERHFVTDTNTFDPEDWREMSLNNTPTTTTTTTNGDGGSDLRPAGGTRSSSTHDMGRNSGGGLGDKNNSTMMMPPRTSSAPTALSSPSTSQNIFRKSKRKRGGDMPSIPILTAPSSSSALFKDEDDDIEAGGRKPQRPTEQSISNKGTHDNTTKRGNTKASQFVYQHHELILTILGLSIFSILGEALRVFVGDLFGGECGASAGTQWVSVFAREANFCVTSSVGALFLDLPANMLGSFLMGFLQPCQDLGLLHASPIAFLPTRHWFQTWGVAHIALRTGFCGSLTTFASWNTQMVELLDGSITKEGPQIIAGLFGYVIGLELAWSSLCLGQTVAIWFHRRANPHLAMAEDVEIHSMKSSKIEVDVDARRLNKNLPDFERRYLDSILLDEETEWTKENMDMLHDLNRWKESTMAHRRMKNKGGSKSEEEDAKHLRLLMDEIEKRIIVDGERPSDLLLAIADEMGWDVDALQSWANSEVEAAEQFAALRQRGDNDNDDNDTSKWWWCDTTNIGKIVCIAIPVGTAIILLLTFGFLSFNSHESVSDFYQEVWMAAMMAPLGTLLRWKLSQFNGKGKHKWKWVPLGTLSANLLAAIISSLMAGFLHTLEYSTNDWLVNGIEAIKVGFAGSLSTVSTFIVEGDKLQKSYPHRAKGYHYTVGSLCTACALGLIVYVPMVRL